MKTFVSDLKTWWEVENMNVRSGCNNCKVAGNGELGIEINKFFCPKALHNLNVTCSLIFVDRQNWKIKLICLFWETADKLKNYKSSINKQSSSELKFDTLHCNTMSKHFRP